MRGPPEQYEVCYCSAKDGLKLAGRKYGWANIDDYPIICLTDLARNSSDFHELACFLSSEEGGNRRVLTLDYRGRGQSEHDKQKSNYSIDIEADDVLAFITSLNINHFDIIGSARGGIIAMMFGGMRAGSLRKIVLNDIGPALDAAGLVHMKKLYEQFKLCNSLDQVTRVMTTFGERHFPALPQSYWQLEASRLFNEVDGKLIPRNDLFISSIISDMDLDARPASFWPQFRGISKMPLTLIRGKHSELLTPETTAKMRKIHSEMFIIEVNGQGHTPKLETGDLPQQIAKFLK